MGGTHHHHWVTVRFSWLTMQQDRKYHSKAAISAHPAPDRDAFPTGEAYAEACMNVDDARTAFDQRPTLTPKQERFCIEYFNTGNASEAYRRAYDAGDMAPATINVKASELLSAGKIAVRLKTMRDGAANSAMMTKADVLREAMKIAKFDIRRLYDDGGAPIPIHELDADTAAAVQAVDIQEVYEGYGAERVFVGYTKKYKVADKNAALEKLFKHFGLYELDNSQKSDPVREFLNACSGKALPINSGPATGDDDD